jgi:hypothetical protein
MFLHFPSIIYDAVFMVIGSIDSCHFKNKIQDPGSMCSIPHFQLKVIEVNFSNFNQKHEFYRNLILINLEVIRSDFK